MQAAKDPTISIPQPDKSDQAGPQVGSRSSSMYTLHYAIRAMGGVKGIKAEKREEIESKSSHKSDIWPPAASKK